MIHSIVIKNSVYFEAQLDVKNLEVDLEKYNGITIISGDNGYGKSALLEFMLPYRRMPSRPGAYKKHFINETGSVSRVWTINGNKYEFIIKCNKNLTDCYIYQFTDTGKVNLMNTTSADEYDTLVEKICGDRVVITKTMFKNKDTQIGGLNESNKKEFFLKIIGGEMYYVIKEISNKLKNKIKLDLDILETSKQNTISFLELKENVDIEEKITSKENILNDINEKIDETSKTIKKILDDNSKINEDKHKKITVENSIKNCNETIELLTSNYAKEVQELNIEEIKILEKESTISNNEAYINKYINKEELKVKFSKYLEDIDSTKNKILLLEKIESKESELQARYLGFQNLTDELNTAKNDLKIILENKCEVDPSQCKNSFQIKNNEDKISALEIKLKTYKTDFGIDLLEKTLNKLFEKIDCPNISNDSKELKKYLTNLLETLPNKETVKNELKELDLVFSKIFAKTEEINKLKNQLLIDTNANKEKSKNISDLENKIKKVKNDLLKFNEELSSFNTEETKDLEIFENDLKKLYVEKDINLIELTKLKSLLDKINEFKTELAVIEKEISDLNIKLERHLFVDDFCNLKDGMPILKLKNFGKIIQDKANSLLDSFRKNGIDYQIEIIDTKLDSTGKKELDCFDINIINKKGKNIDLNLLSSGQKMIIETALSLSAAQYNSADKFKVLLLDEVDNSLSGTNTDSLYRTLELIKTNLDIKQIFIVSHKGEVQNMCFKELKLEVKKEKY